MMSQRALLSSRRFLPLFVTLFLGAFNDNLLKNGLVILVTWKSIQVMGLPPAQIVALAGALLILPFLIFSATAGQLADKVEKSKLIRWTKVAEIFIMCLAFYAFWSELWAVLMLVIFLTGTQSAFFSPVKYGILPQHLGDHEIVGGNALVEAGTFVAILLGTIGGGTLVLAGDQGPVILGALTIVVSIVGWIAARLIPIAPPVDTNLNVQWNPGPPTAEIIRDARKNRTVFHAIFGISWFWLFGAVILSVFPTWCKDFLVADASVATFFLALFSVGIAAGSMMCEAMSRKRLELGLVPFGSIGMSIFAFDIMMVGRPDFAMAAIAGTGAAEATAVSITTLLSSFDGLRIVFDLLMMSVFSGFFTVPLYTLIQTRSEVSHRSRTIAANNILNALFMVSGAIALMGMNAIQLTHPQMFGVLAIMNAVVAIYIYSLIPEFMLRFCAWIIASIMYRMRVTGHEHVPAEGPAVLICNHVTFVDWLLISAGVKRPLRFVMHHAFYKGIIGRTLMRQAKVIPIAGMKESPEIMERAFARVAEELSAGELVCIFPEGKLTPDGALCPFRPGIERIIGTSPVPVVPMVLTNVWGSFFSRQGGKAIAKVPKRFWSAIELRIGSPIPAARVTAAGLQATVQKMLDQE